MKEQKIFDLYDSIFSLQETKYVCEQCRNMRELDGPVSIWQLGDEFDSSKYRVLFVGKTARGLPEGSIFNQTFWDSTNRANHLYKKETWSYWSYTRSICESLYEVDSWEKIAFTNMVKCNASDTTDLTDDNIKHNCIIENEIVLKEILCIKPLHIVFYTSYNYDSYIKSMFQDYHIITTADTTRPIGAKQLPWWEFNITIDNQIVRCLRTGHPERKKKDAFVEAVSNFIMGEHLC